MTLLRARSLVAGRGRFRLGPLDLHVAAGSLTALIGPNGAGKTTLLKTLAGVLPPLSGKLERSGAMALLPAPGTVSVPFSVRHFVLLGRVAEQRWGVRFSVSDRARADEVLAQLGLEPLRDARFDRLSSGQQQRVMLARAIVQDARICLLDEPFALLDPAQAAQVDAMLTALRASGRALMIATHDIGLALRADQVVATGTTVAVGPPGAMITSDRLRELYGTAFSACQSCGQASAVTTTGA